MKSIFIYGYSIVIKNENSNQFRPRLCKGFLRCSFFVVVASLYIEKDILQYLLSINGVMKIEL